MFFDKLVKMAESLLVGTYVARYLGPDDFGIFSYAISIAVFLSVFCNLGIGQILILRLISYPDEKNKYIGSAFFLKLTAFIAGYLTLFILFSYFSSDSYAKLIIFIVSWYVFFECFFVIDLYFQSQIKAKYSAISSAISLFIVAIIRIYFVRIELPLIFFALLVVIEKAILSFFLIYFFKRDKNDILTWKMQTDAGLSILSESWPLIFSGIAITIYMRIDQIMIKELLGESQTGIYSSAILLSSSFYAIPVIVCNSLFPAIINAKKNQAQYINRIQQLHDFLTWGIFAVSFIITYYSKLIISIFFGVDYQAAAPILSMHIWCTLFIAWGGASAKWYIIESLTKIAFFRNLCGAAANILLNFILIPKYGIAGAAVASLISFSIAYYFFDALLKSTRVMFIVKTKTLIAPFRYFL